MDALETVYIRIVTMDNDLPNGSLAQNLSGATFVVTGGTGSFGQTLIRYLLNTGVSKIVCFSRDESKQHALQQIHTDSRVKFVLGDVRDINSLSQVLNGADYLFHAAALKHVPAGEVNSWQFINTNVIGSHNVIQALARSSVRKAVFLSTDKAVMPLNTMGMTKGLMEKLVRSEMTNGNSENFITRYGNVIGSRGSVIPQFIANIKNGDELSVTNYGMTRFMMTLDESVDLVMYALSNGEAGDLFVQKSPAATVSVIIEALEIILQKKAIRSQELGIRPGEKIHETLLTAEERSQSIERDRYFHVKSQPVNQRENLQDYTSNSTEMLDAASLAELLSKTPEIKTLL
jgi:UDP-N-acetylglucosamine 4,6-dehydratase